MKNIGAKSLPIDFTLTVSSDVSVKSKLVLSLDSVIVDEWDSSSLDIVVDEKSVSTSLGGNSTYSLENKQKKQIILIIFGKVYLLTV